MSPKTIQQLQYYVGKVCSIVTTSMNRAFDEWIPKDCAPARATIGNVKFPNPLWKVEIA